MAGATLHRRPPHEPTTTQAHPGQFEPVSLSSPTRRRSSWVLVGALLVVFAGLMGAYVFAATSDLMSVVVAARDIEPGEVIDVDDLRVVEMGRSSELRAVQSSQQDLVLGLAARGPIPAGTVLNTDLFASRGETIPPGMTVVGAALEPGAAPISGLRAGDRVDVLAVAPTTAQVDDVAAQPSATVVTAGSVWRVEAVGTGATTSRIWVALLVPAESQGLVAQAAADGLLRVSLVGAEP